MAVVLVRGDEEEVVVVVVVVEREGRGKTAEWGGHRQRGNPRV